MHTSLPLISFIYIIPNVSWQNTNKKVVHKSSMEKDMKFDDSYFYDRDSVIQHVKNLYGNNKKLIWGCRRNGDTIHYRCSVRQCQFQILHRKIK